MKKLLLHTHTFNDFWAHYCFYKDSYFIDKLKQLGYQLYLSNQVEDIFSFDKVLFSEAYSVGMHHLRLKSWLKYTAKKIIGSAKEDIYTKFVSAGMRGKLAFAAFEVPIHIPEHGDEKLFSMFEVNFTINDDLVNNRNIFKFCCPQPFDWPEADKVSFGAKKMLVNISSNKTSKHSTELYSFRNSDIEYFDKTTPKNFDLYGFGWGANKITYKGILKEHKTNTYSRYRFGLCYENAVYPGNIDEKIFDCMRSNCVPIFLGAPNVKDYVDKDAFIDRRDFATPDKLKRYLFDMSEFEYERYLGAIRSYLASARFGQFLSPAFAETIVRGLEFNSN